MNTAELQPQTMMFIDTNSTSDQVKTVLLNANIELMIAAKEHLHHYGLNPEYLRVVAPIVDISWMEMGWKEHLRLIARSIQRSDRAEKWLADFEKKNKLLVHSSSTVKSRKKFLQFSLLNLGNYSFMEGEMSAT